MIVFKSADLYPGVSSCDLLSLTDGVPSVSVWTKRGALEDEVNIIPADPGDNWVDLIVDHYQLHKSIVVDVLAAHFKVPVAEINIITHNDIRN